MQPLNSKLWPKGCLVDLPSGKVARVMGYTDDGRLRLRYLGGDATNVVDLFPHHCKRRVPDERVK